MKSRLDSERAQLLETIATKIHLSTDDVWKEIPLAIRWYGIMINQKVIGGYLKRMLNEEGERVTQLSPQDIFHKQLTDDMKDDETFQNKVKAVIENQPMMNFITKIANIFGIKLSGEALGFDITKAALTNPDKLVQFVTASGDSEATKIVSWIDSHESETAEVINAGKIDVQILGEEKGLSTSTASTSSGEDCS